MDHSPCGTSCSECCSSCNLEVHLTVLSVDGDELYRKCLRSGDLFRYSDITEVLNKTVRIHSTHLEWSLDDCSLTPIVEHLSRRQYTGVVDLRICARQVSPSPKRGPRLTFSNDQLRADAASFYPGAKSHNNLPNLKVSLVILNIAGDTLFQRTLSAGDSFTYLDILDELQTPEHYSPVFKYAWHLDLAFRTRKRLVTPIVLDLARLWFTEPVKLEITATLKEEMRAFYDYVCRFEPELHWPLPTLTYLLNDIGSWKKLLEIDEETMAQHIDDKDAAFLVSALKEHGVSEILADFQSAEVYELAPNAFEEGCACQPRDFLGL